MDVPQVSNATLSVTVQAWGPVNDQAGGGWGWFPVARIENPASTDIAVLRQDVLRIFGALEQMPASNVARLEFRSNGVVTARATLTDLW